MRIESYNHETWQIIIAHICQRYMVNKVIVVTSDTKDTIYYVFIIIQNRECKR